MAAAISRKISSLVLIFITASIHHGGDYKDSVAWDVTAVTEVGYRKPKACCCDDQHIAWTTVVGAFLSTELWHERAICSVETGNVSLGDLSSTFTTPSKWPGNEESVRTSYLR
jgi:hypothetical protein